DEMRRINVFDWEKEFPEIMKNGGFDAVIGNPPYGAEFPDKTLDYLKNKFTTHVWRGESYLLFVEQGHRLLKLGGLFGFITPDTYLNLGFTQPLRTFLLRNSCLQEVVSLPSKVFPGATVDTTLLFTEKTSPTKTFHESNVRIRSFNKKSVISSIDQAESDFYLSTKNCHEQTAFNISSNDSENLMIASIDNKCKQLSSFAEMFSGIKVYEIGKGNPPQTEVIRDTKPFTSDIKESQGFQPFFDGKHIGRYALLWRENNWLKYGPWLAAPRNAENFVGDKILIRKIIGPTLIATYIPETSYCNTLLHVLKIKPESPQSYRYLLGILNSRFIGWYFRKKFQISPDDTFPQIMIRDILQFPVPEINKALHDKMVSLVDRMLDLNKKLQAVKIAHEKELL
ncbi:MAG: TaqI-like C-terminal specificity domain-containing protein, partial [Patescibacteria group bacterium]